MFVWCQRTMLAQTMVVKVVLCKEAILKDRSATATMMWNTFKL